MNDIKKQAFLGILWRGAYYIVNQLGAFLVKLVLIRLLVPADFGLLAMAMIVLTSFELINRFAAAEPFIRDDISDPYKAKNTFFFLALSFLGLITLLGFLSAPYVALFFLHQISATQTILTLIMIIRIFFLRLGLSIVASVSVAVLTKELRFEKLYTANIAGSFTYAVLAISLAYLGFGIWSIVYASLAEQIVITALFLYYSPFFPSLIFDTNIAKKYLRYNSNIFASSIVLLTISKGGDALIGRLMGPSPLGYYNIGQQLAMLATVIVSSNITSVVFPVLSRIQHDTERFTTVFFKSFRLITFLAIPFIGGSLVVVNDIVFVLLGEKWAPVLPIFYILSFSALLNCITSIAGPVFASLNKPHLVRISQSIGLIIFLLLIFPFVRFWGYIGVCWVMVFVSIVDLIYLTPKLASQFSGFYTTVSRMLSKTFFVTLFMMAFVYFIKSFLPHSLLGLFLSILVGIIVYLSLMLFCDRQLIEDFQGILRMVKDKARYSTASRHIV